MKALILALLLAAASLTASAQGYDKRADVKAFVQGMVERHGFAEKELLFLFSRVQRREPILQAITPPPPGRGRSWTEYRAMFVNERLAQDGAAFWRKHAEALARASREYGVPQEIIVAIIGIETVYGRNMGKWRVVDALTTLAFDYPPRADYFRGELENYLILARDSGFDVFSVLGSFAGAIGIPQFMPTSILKWAVDFDGNGVTDLRGSPVDAIGSVANFLKQHGWKPGEPILLSATVSGDAWKPYADGTVLPKHPLTDIGKAGVAFSGGLPATQGIVIELENRDAPAEYRVGLMNFWVITRYNRSSFYATAVFDLAEAIREARK
jgi:membrane-bound lytic murein transglycosylase B